jgi:hypothetical protein
LSPPPDIATNGGIFKGLPIDVRSCHRLPVCARNAYSSTLKNVPSRASQCPRCAVHSEHCLSTTLQPATTPINVISVHLLPARNAHRSTLTPPCGPPAQGPRNVGTLHTLQGDACARGRPMTNAGAVRATIKDPWSPLAPVCRRVFTVNWFFSFKMACHALFDNLISRPAVRLTSSFLPTTSSSQLSDSKS